MNHIKIKKFGLALGTTAALLYLGCMIVMIIAGREGAVQFFNTILHGLDVASVIRMDVPIWEALVGIVQTFIIGWLVGACIAGIYNATTKSTT